MVISIVLYIYLFILISIYIVKWTCQSTHTYIKFINLFTYTFMYLVYLPINYLSLILHFNSEKCPVTDRCRNILNTNLTRTASLTKPTGTHSKTDVATATSSPRTTRSSCADSWVRTSLVSVKYINMIINYWITVVDQHSCLQSDWRRIQFCLSFKYCWVE